MRNGWPASDLVIALRQLGLSQQAIARQVGIGASTVQSWVAAGTFPERKPRKPASQLDRYLPSLVQRWAEGCHTSAGLFRELVEQGYKGSYASVRDNLVRLLASRAKAPGRCLSQDTGSGDSTASGLSVAAAP